MLTVLAPVLQISLQVPATSPPKNLEIFQKWGNFFFKEQAGFQPMTIVPPALALACSATQLDAAGCCFVLPTPYHYNTNPPHQPQPKSKPLVTNRLPKPNLLVTNRLPKPKPPAPASLATSIVLSNSLFYNIAIDPKPL